MQVYIESYGCSANQNNSEIISGLLQRSGFIIVNDPKNADILILNTCVVKGATERKMRSRIEELLKIKKKLIVTGCMPDVEAKIIKSISPEIVLVGNHAIKEIVNAVRRMIEGNPIDYITKNNEIKLCLPKAPINRVIGITQISEGCLGNCAYCYTRYAKGSLFSYPKDLILKSVEADLKAGMKEIWITSQDNAAYGLDNNKRELPALLKSILNLRHRFMLRLGMMNPDNVMKILPDLIDVYEDKKMFKFIHIPVQSGSDNVLESMRRRYKAKDFVRIVKAFREKFSDITIATDVICGFPSESEEDFQKTIDLIDEIKPDVMNISKFTSMPNTLASRMKQLNSEVVKKRSIILTILHRKFLIEKNKGLVGKVLRCIIDEKEGDRIIARTPSYRKVIVNSGNIGDIADVEITGYTENLLIGKIKSR